MIEKIDITLRDGTLVRHKMKGYEGKIEGTTAIKACFTKGGDLLEVPLTKEPYQYRVVIGGAVMRCVAPMEDLEVIDAAVEIVCFRCQKAFCSKPGLPGKPAGRCSCTGWICPVCLGCQPEDAINYKSIACAQQRKRFVKKLAAAAKK